MSQNAFVKEMQDILRDRASDGDTVRKRSSETPITETPAWKNWDILIHTVTESLAEINEGLSDPSLAYLKTADDEFNITNNRTNLNLTVKRESNGDLVYRGSAAAGIFRVQAGRNEVKYSWERTMSTPTLRVAFGSIGVSVTIEEIGELLIRAVVTP